MANKLTPGYYLIKRNNRLMPARWNGTAWNHEGEVFNYAEIVPHNWIAKARKFLGFKPKPIAYTCPTGCTCTLNPDGSTTVNCTGGGHGQ